MNIFKWSFWACIFLVLPVLVSGCFVEHREYGGNGEGYYEQPYGNNYDYWGPNYYVAPYGDREHHEHEHHEGEGRERGREGGRGGERGGGDHERAPRTVPTIPSAPFRGPR